jgi:predicted molibdopterin-dependent oxidoreductase YjgC
MVRVASRRGSVVVKAKITDRSQEGMVFLAFHHRNALTNILTSGFRDPVTGTHEYKFSAVRIEKT